MTSLADPKHRLKIRTLSLPIITVTMGQWANGTMGQWDNGTTETKKINTSKLKINIEKL